MAYPPVNEETLKRGLSILARVIDTQGNAAWPLFERLDQELDALRGRRARIESYLKDHPDL